jgi:spermidine synthase
MERRAPQEVSGLLFAWNTLGSISGALLTSVLLIPAFGLQSSYVAMAALPLLAALLVLSGARGWGRTARLAAAAALALALVLLGGAWRPWDLRLMTAGIYRNGVDWVRTAPPGFFWLRDALRASRDIVFYDEGREAVVSVARTGGDNSILVNGKADGGTSRWDSATQKLLAHVPLIIHPDPRKALVIGWGTGGTAGSAALHPLRDLHVVEIEPAVFRAAEFFEGVNLGVARDPRQRVTFEDARTVLLTSPETYDVIISEPSNPWISGVSNLFTEEFYRIALPRLLTDGIFCQWFHYYGMTVEDIRAQVRTFTAVFPHASLWIAPPITPEGGPSTVSGDLLLLGSRSPMVLDAGRVRARIADPAVAANLAGVGVQEAIDLLLDQVMDEEDLRAFAGEGRHNTDDDPLIEFSAPRGLFLGPEERTRILGLLESGGRAVVPRILHEPGLDAGASAGERAAAYVRLAGVMRRKEMLERSARLLRTALALDGNVAAAHASLGEIRYVQGRREEAEQALGRALEQDPGLKQPYMLLGFLYFERRNLSEARRMFDGLTDRFPDEAAGYYGQALVDAEGKDWARSKERLKTALSIQPGFEQARRLLEFVDGQSR